MGIAMRYINYLESHGVFSPGMSILDIGSSNLYLADAAEIVRFIEKYNPGIKDKEAFARRLAEGSSYSSETGGSNLSFAGELFEACGFKYVSFDIADGYKTTIIDLNKESLPEDLHGQFDLVLNFGTTEHIINQLNCFRVMHEAANKDGHIFHQLPAFGFSNHGYFTYTGRFFFDLAGYNQYLIKDFEIGMPHGQNNVFQSVKDYATHFPVLGEFYKNQESKGKTDPLNSMKIYDVPINILYQKPHELPFFIQVEFSTSVGEVSHAVFKNAIRV